MSTSEPSADDTSEQAVGSDPDLEAARARSAREAAFYDNKPKSYDRVRGLIVRAMGHFPRADDMDLFYDPVGKDVLDIGCGDAHELLGLFDHGARTITGFDISQAEIDEAVREAARRGVSDRTDFSVRDAHATGYPDDAFDLILGGSILHHLELRPALREIRRILRPGGRAVFLEPLASNPFLRLGRLLTPTARTPDEHPLTLEDWELCREVFPDFEHHERELVTIPLMPVNLLLTDRAQRRLAARVHRWDDRLLERHPKLRRYARISIIVLK